MGDGHYRHNRRSKNLIKTLRMSRSNAVRLKILEELHREFARMGQSRWGKAMKRGAIGTSKWGKRVGAQAGRGARRVGSAARTATAAGGRYAREQARQRNDSRPARQATKAQKRDERAKQRATRAKQRGGRGRAAWVSRMRPARTAPAKTRNDRMANGGNSTITRVSTPRPAPGKRAARAAKAARTTPAARTARTTPAARTARTTPAARPARTPRGKAG